MPLDLMQKIQPDQAFFFRTGASNVWYRNEISPFDESDSSQSADSVHTVERNVIESGLFVYFKTYGRMNECLADQTNERTNE